MDELPGFDPMRRYSLREVGEKGWLFGLSYITLRTMALEGRLKPPTIIVIRGNTKTNYRIMGKTILEILRKGKI